MMSGVDTNRLFVSLQVEAVKSCIGQVGPELSGNGSMGADGRRFMAITPSEEQR